MKQSVTVNLKHIVTIIDIIALKARSLGYIKPTLKSMYFRFLGSKRVQEKNCNHHN